VTKTVATCRTDGEEEEVAWTSMKEATADVPEAAVEAAATSDEAVRDELSTTWPAVRAEKLRIAEANRGRFQGIERLRLVAITTMPSRCREIGPGLHERDQQTRGNGACLLDEASLVRLR